MVFIYTLLLSNNKYYIGKTKNPNFRIEEHFAGNGAAWTHKYHPIKILELIPNCDDYDEDKYVVKYMQLYGIDNVRGGSFSQITLNFSHKSTLIQMIHGSGDKCFTCGKSGHFSNKCPTRTLNTTPTKPTCSRCRRYGHGLNECYARTDVSGNALNTPLNVPINHNQDGGLRRFFRGLLNIFRK